ncbi:MAG: IS66 family transposase [Oligoflexales bacterium]
MKTRESLPENQINPPNELVNSLKNQLVCKQETIDRMSTQIKNLHAVIDGFKREKFAPKSEAIHPGQGTLFNEPEVLVTDKKSHEELSPVKGYKKRKARKKTLSDTIPREQKIIDLTPDQKICSCGCEMKKIGEDVSEKVEYIPQKVKVIQNIRPKYSCPKCKEKIVQEPAPKAIIQKSFASESLLAAIITAKYCDGLPLYRQESIWKRAGIELKRARMAHWMIKTAKELMPLYNLIKEHTFSWNVVHIDETVVQVLKEEGRSAASKSYAWIAARADEKPSVYFEYHPSRSGKIAAEILDAYSGYVLTDGYRAYDVAMADRYKKHCGCWDHCRREFFKAYEAAKKDPSSLAAYALHYIRILYLIERREKESSSSRRKIARSLYSKAVLDRLKSWMLRNIDKVPKTSNTGKALHYMYGQWDKLTRFLESGDVPISNERAENSIRPFVIGRKAWLFSDTVDGADASMCLYTIVETAKANGHEPFHYYTRILTKIPYCKTIEDYEALLPWNLNPEN